MARELITCPFDSTKGKVEKQSSVRERLLAPSESSRVKTAVCVKSVPACLATISSDRLRLQHECNNITTHSNTLFIAPDHQHKVELALSEAYHQQLNSTASHRAQAH